MRQDLTTPVDKYTLINGDYEVCPGVKCISLPGHSAGMMGLQIELDHGGTYLFARDAAYLAVNYGPPSLPASFMYNLEDYYASHEKLRKLESCITIFIASRSPFVATKMIGQGNKLRSSGLLISIFPIISFFLQKSFQQFKRACPSSPTKERQWKELCGICRGENRNQLERQAENRCGRAYPAGIQF